MTAYGLSDGLGQLGGSPGRLLGWLGVVITAVAAFLQYRASKPFELTFVATSWQTMPEAKEYFLIIPADRHRKGTAATAIVFESNPSGYAEVVCDVHTLEGGAVKVNCSTPFSGKVVVK